MTRNFNHDNRNKLNHHNNNHCSIHNAIHHINHHGANPVTTTGPQQEGTALAVDPAQ